LVDDEELALLRLKKLLAPYSDTIHIVGTAGSGQEAVSVINELQPDLVFLDIQMPELNGFEVLENLDYMPLVIFSTAYDQYALRAFETNSIDYLLKPVSSERLKEAIEKLERLTASAYADTNQNLISLLNDINAKPGKLQVRVGKKIKLIDVGDICYFKADNKYVEVHTFDQMYLVTKPLHDIENTLPRSFRRIHRSCIVNSDFVDEIVPMSKSVHLVILKDQQRSRLTMSRNYKDNLLE
jgi:two-component system LytT family response regulator